MIKMSLQRFYRALAMFLCSALVAGTALAETHPKIKTLGGDPPKTILFVGNSFFYFNNSMHRYVTGIARAADAANKGLYGGISVTISGSGLNWHDMESYFKTPAFGSYSFTADNNVVFNKAGRPFDVVLMNDCSQCPIHPQLKDAFHDTVKAHSATVVKHGAKPALFMTWAYADKPEMTAQLAEQYTIAGNANDALVVPAGLAFAKSRAKMPDLNLYDADKRHPSLAGTYLAAATIYATFSGKSPVGVPYNGGLDPKIALHLQETAWATVQEYFGK